MEYALKENTLRQQNMGKLDKKHTRCDFRNESYLSELKKPKVDEEARFVLIRSFFGAHQYLLFAIK